MQVKCVDTDDKIDRDLAYKVIVNGKNKYYSSKEGYDNCVMNNSYRTDCIKLIREIMGYVFKEMKLPTLTYKKIAEYKEPIGYDVLYNTLVNQKENIEWHLYNKQFDSESKRVAYLFGIVRNHYIEEYQKKIVEKRMKRTSESEFEDLDEINTIERKQKVKNLSRYLDED